MSDFPCDPGSDLTEDRLVKLMQHSARRAASVDPLRQPHHGFGKLEERILHARAWAGLINEIPIKARGGVGSFERLVKRMLKWMVHWNTDSQAEFNATLVTALDLMAGQLRKSGEDFTAIWAALARERALAEESTKRIATSLEELSGQLREVIQRSESLMLSVYWSDVERRLGDEIDRIREENALQLKQVIERLNALSKAIDGQL
jgi:hypothetical protein